MDSAPIGYPLPWTGLRRAIYAPQPELCQFWIEVGLRFGLTAFSHIDLEVK